MFESNPLIFYTTLLVALVMIRIPYAGKFFRVVDTMIHETGHAFMALLTKGEVLSVELFNDTSGVAVTKNQGKLGFFMVSLAGYPFSSLMSYVLFYLLYHQHMMAVTLIFVSIASVNLILWVRNWYGVFWLFSFLLIYLFAYLYLSWNWMYVINLFFAALLLFDSIIKSVELFFIAIKNSKQSGDAYNLKQITMVPAVFWALIFVAIAFLMLYLIIKLYYQIV